MYVDDNYFKYAAENVLTENDVRVVLVLIALTW